MATALILGYLASLAQIRHLVRRIWNTASCSLRLPGALTILLLLLLVLGSRPTQAAEANSPGEIVLGMSTVLTGAASDLGKDMQRGILAGFERANRTGGVSGRKLRLIALDDGYVPARTAVNMRQLIETDQAQGLPRVYPG